MRQGVCLGVMDLRAVRVSAPSHLLCLCVNISYRPHPPPFDKLDGHVHKGDGEHGAVGDGEGERVAGQATRIFIIFSVWALGQGASTGEVCPGSTVVEVPAGVEGKGKAFVFYVFGQVQVVLVITEITAGGDIVSVVDVVDAVGVDIEGGVLC